MRPAQMLQRALRLHLALQDPWARAAVRYGDFPEAAGRSLRQTNRQIPNQLSFVIIGSVGTTNRAQKRTATRLLTTATCQGRRDGHPAMLFWHGPL